MTPPNILWLDTATDLYEVTRAVEAGKKLGLQVDAIDPHDVHFAADSKQIGAFIQGKNLVDAYDVLVVRAFIPMISESLTLARLFKEAGKIVIDDSLTTEGYAMSKLHDYVVLAKHGIAVPHTHQFSDANDLVRRQTAGYLCVIKGGMVPMEACTQSNLAAICAELMNITRRSDGQNTWMRRSITAWWSWL